MKLQIPLFLCMILCFACLHGQVSITEEPLTLPTYIMGEDEPNPLFKEYTLPGFEVFRSDRSVYPYTLQDEFTRNSKDVTYMAVNLENEYIKATVLPELRGRLQGAYDKRNNWDFIYFNNVIKPADIGIRMAWIAGGLEWNHPGGHGYTQFIKIPYVLKEYKDGSKSVIVSEIEPVRKMKWETEIKLSPGKLYLETTCRLISISPYPVPFASSLNGAMHTSDELEIILPEGTHYTGHGKNSLNEWPYFNKIDVSWLKNTKDVFSIFAEGEGLYQDYWGCYSHDKNIDAGTVIVSDHRFAPGKKYFTWGSHEKARLWDTFLSDEDGGYIELQVQAFWDNLGYGYAWLEPNEQKEFTVYWYPLSQTGGFISASKDACLNLRSLDNNELELIIQATDIFNDAQISCFAEGEKVFDKVVDLMPENPFREIFKLPAEKSKKDIHLGITDAEGRVMLEYKPYKGNMPAPQLPQQNHDPKKMSMDQLWAKGKSWYQDPFGSEAEFYYRNMLKRDSLESRANRELGVIMWDRGLPDSAIWFFNRALINDHLNEAAETYLYLASVYKTLGNYEMAEKYLANSIRKKDFYTSSLRSLGQIALMQQDYEVAVDYFEQILQTETKHTHSLVEMAISLRKSGQIVKAREIIGEALESDPLSFYALAENWLEENINESAKRLNLLFDRNDRTFVGSYLYFYTAGKYMDLNLWDDALAILSEGIDFYRGNNEKVYPLLYYYAGYCYGKLGKADLKKLNYNLAKDDEISYVFPFSSWDQKVLEDVVSFSPDDANALSVLGCLYAYQRQHFKAIENWEKALLIENDNPVIYHNLAGAYWKTTGEIDKATEFLEKAVHIKPEDTRLILELDHLYEYQNRTEDRFKLYKNYERILNESDELVLRYAKLNISEGKDKEAIRWMTDHSFFPREANHMQPVVITIFMEAHLGLGIRFLKEGSYEKALQYFDKSIEFPESLNDIPPEIFVSSRLDYYKGLAMKAMGMENEAELCWSNSLKSPSRKGFECDVYRVRMLKLLGRNQEANELLNSIIELNKEKLETLKDNNELAMSYIILSQAIQEKGDEAMAQDYMNKGLLLDRNAIFNTRIQSAHVPIIRN